jgi:hypothetical protein
MGKIKTRLGGQGVFLCDYINSPYAYSVGGDFKIKPAIDNH